MYDAEFFFVPNALDRWMVGDRTRGMRRNRDGSLTVYVQRNAPATGRRSNWLPAPAGAFTLMLRLYQPRASVVNGRWTPPTVARVG